MNNGNDQAFMAGVIIGHVLAILFCFGLPLGVGVSRGHTALGIVGAVLSAAAAIPFACMSGFPVALIFVIVILALGKPAKPRRRDHDDDYDDDEDYDEPRRGRRRADDDYYDDDDDYRRKRRDY